jgi:predicted DNA-binding protein (MmcQ/YjbR family)
VAVSSRRARILSPSARDTLEKLRRICAAIGDCEERTSFGHPAFRVAGRDFAVIDHYSGADCLWLRIDPTRRSELLRDPGWFVSPYDPQQKALCYRLDQIDWRRVRPLIRDSFDMARLPTGGSRGRGASARHHD